MVNQVETAVQPTPAHSATGPAADAAAMPVQHHEVTDPNGLSLFARSVGARLRAVRVQQGLSLHAVEERSGGLWKAVVVGSYERGDRAVTATRLAELADFYRVPLDHLLPADRPRVGPAPGAPLVLNLDQLRAVPDERAGVLERFAAAIAAQRGDYNGRVLSIRRDDLRTLAVLFDEPASALIDRLRQWGILLAEPTPERAGSRQPPTGG